MLTLRGPGGLSTKFPATTDQPPLSAHEALRELRIRRRELVNSIGSLKAYGFDSIAKEDEAELKSLDRKIFALQLKSGVTEDPVDAA
jgi:hypothetical protein